MRIFITSRGRWSKQVTLRALPEEVLRETSLVVPYAEYRNYRQSSQVPSHVPVHIRPESVTNLSQCRQFILDEFVEDEPFVLLDDDVRFYTRTDELVAEPGKEPWYRLKNATADDVWEMFGWLEVATQVHGHAAISFRTGNRGTTAPVRPLGGRQYMLLAYDAKVLKKLGARFDRLPLMSDFDMTLQLLRAGYRNPMNFQFAIGQEGSNKAGGCSVYRTQELMSRAATGLHSLHPEFVKVVDKTTKSGWFAKEGENTRLDVMVAWRRAYLSSGKTLP